MSSRTSDFPKLVTWIKCRLRKNIFWKRRMSISKLGIIWLNEHFCYIWINFFLIHFKKSIGALLKMYWAYRVYKSFDFMHQFVLSGPVCRDADDSRGVRWDVWRLTLPQDAEETSALRRSVSGSVREGQQVGQEVASAAAESSSIDGNMSTMISHSNRLKDDFSHSANHIFSEAWF